jgi:hypothetical protein
MFSRFGLIAAALLTLAAAVFIAVAIHSHDSLAGIAVLVVALLYVGAMIVLLISDYWLPPLGRSRSAVRSSGHLNR